MSYTFVEPFAGAAALSLRLVGGRNLIPPVSWMGGKRRLARDILGAMGVPLRTKPRRVVLCDAGPWGLVWPLIFDRGRSQKVAGWLRRWDDEGLHARDLWNRLVSDAPYDDPCKRAAQWLWLQARSASGVPVWWSGSWRMGDKSKQGHRSISQKGARRGGGGLMIHATIADRIEAICDAFAVVDVTVYHGDALSECRRWLVESGEGTREEFSEPVFVYADPPYVGATGYGWDCPREQQIAIARAWRNVGAVAVAVSEAVPLDIDGWHHLEVTRPGGKPEWLTLSRPPVRVPQKQQAMFASREHNDLPSARRDGIVDGSAVRP